MAIQFKSSTGFDYVSAATPLPVTLSGNINIGSGSITAGAISGTRLGVGVSPDATIPILVGGNYAPTTSVDAQVVVSRSLTTGSSNAHAFSDSTNFARATFAYNSFDAIPTLSGTDLDHYSGVQVRPVLSHSGTISNLYGFADSPDVNSGTLTNRYGFKVSNAGGAGTIGTEYGLFVATLSRATTKWGVYVEGNDSFFGGNTGVGASSPDIFGRGYGRILGISSATNAGLEINSATGYGAYFDLGVNGSRTFALYSDVSSTDIGTVGANRPITISPSGSTVATFSSTAVTLAVALKLSNAYVAGAVVGTGSVTIQDSNGTTYRVPVLV